jgi:uncharacterized protein
VAKKQRRPQRTCLGCGTQDEQDQLMRLALADDGRLVIDRFHGRGGYLHRKQSCWQAFLGRKSHYRAFRVEVSRAAKERLIQELKDRDWE